ACPVGLEDRTGVVLWLMMPYVFNHSSRIKDPASVIIGPMPHALCVYSTNRYFPRPTTAGEKPCALWAGKF
ncbi:hypothetical protein DRH13_03795, partial [Candidatus Woesebacteria bacterium]